MQWWPNWIRQRPSKPRYEGSNPSHCTTFMSKAERYYLQELNFVCWAMMRYLDRPAPEGNAMSSDDALLHMKRTGEFIDNNPQYYPDERKTTDQEMEMILTKAKEDGGSCSN